LGRVGGVTAATLAASIGAPSASAQGLFGNNNKCDDDNFPFGIEPLSMTANRYTKSYNYRVSAAKLAKKRHIVIHLNNGDESRYANKIGSFTKALPHNQLGEVDPLAYATLAKAVQTRNPADWEAIQLG